MKKSKHILALCALVSSSAAFALAVDFATVDTDGSGAISMEEASKHPELISQFKDLDTNVDGELSQEEFAKAK
ncbi:calmodulin [Pseudoalteromonas sp. YIC-827]|uniref:Calmodulin n=1 Tax=Pseudoalteromonas qingdaonensis TaxID=3131913 RepID=A0ABU9MZE6_9GAMM